MTLQQHAGKANRVSPLPQGNGAGSFPAFPERAECIRPNLWKTILFPSRTRPKCTAVMGLQVSVTQPLSWGGLQCHNSCHGCPVEGRPLSKHMRQHSSCWEVNTINASSDSRQRPSPQRKRNSQKGLQGLHCNQCKGSAIRECVSLPRH